MLLNFFKKLFVTTANSEAYAFKPKGKVSLTTVSVTLPDYYIVHTVDSETVYECRRCGAFSTKYKLERNLIKHLKNKHEIIYTKTGKK